ncbi:LysR family transcriptional regulator [Pseudomonas sp. A4]|uniref:LysR family transcriptional regulator n=1 Tax=Pseudomonas sp. S11P7 TaxID=3029169 RepID=UPI00215C4482|nr:MULTISPECIES: LysR family transcriptional regulator [unclassified Pseudomonas]MCR8931572.1 LysR family transcriptional regulator [Pseudomonas sp. S11A4]MCR8975179.1 LysR family transcriptional regulator [Pseudomonas sp. S11P7]
MDIEELQTFVAVADAGGISSAATRLGVSKSIVSRRLARLEADLGIQLLARTTRGAALTEAGIAFRDHAAKACAEMDMAKETLLPAGRCAADCGLPRRCLLVRRISPRCWQKWRAVIHCCRCRLATAIASLT